MIEVFKTNVKGTAQAKKLTAEIQRIFPEYEVNFDLEDCDHVLRIETSTSEIAVSCLIDLLVNHGFQIGILEDVVPV